MGSTRTGSTRRGAYRNFVSSETTGICTASLGYLTQIDIAAGIKISGEVKERNILALDRRNIRGDSLDIVLDIGLGNMSSLYFRSKTPYSVNTHYIKMGNNNITDIRTQENPLALDLGSGNRIKGSFNSGDIYIGDDNILADFDGLIKKDTVVYSKKKLGTLMYLTRTVESSVAGSVYITVDDASLVAFNEEIKFGSIGAAFVSRKVTKVEENRIFFNSPLTQKEATYIGAIVFNDSPEIIESVSFQTTGEAKAMSKRVPIDATLPLPLRDIVIGGIFSTKVFFVRSSDNIAIIKDLLPNDFPMGTSMFAPGRNIYKGESYGVVAIKSANTVEVDNLSGVFIGRIMSDENGISYKVVGFGDNKVTFSSTIDENITLLTVSEIIKEAETASSQSTVISEVSADTIRIPIRGESFSVGDSIQMSGFSGSREVVAVFEDEVEISEGFMPSELNSMVGYGRYLVPRNESNRLLILESTKDIHSYLFGER